MQAADKIAYSDDKVKLGVSQILMKHFKVFDIASQSKQKLRSRQRDKIFNIYATIRYLPKPP